NPDPTRQTTLRTWLSQIAPGRLSSRSPIEASSGSDQFPCGTIVSPNAPLLCARSDTIEGRPREMSGFASYMSPHERSQEGENRRPRLDPLLRVSEWTSYCLCRFPHWRREDVCRRSCL